MPAERRGQAIAFEIGSTGDGRNPMFNGRRQPSCGGTSRMMREYQVRICERLGVKFPGPTRPIEVPSGAINKRSIEEGFLFLRIDPNHLVVLGEGIGVILPAVAVVPVLEMNRLVLPR